MSTRARVGLQLDTGTIRSIYVHFDGYPEGLGATLVENYTTPELIEELISYGDASVIGKTISDCVYYTRDKKESVNSTKPETSLTVKAYVTKTEANSGEYYYIFDNGEWQVGSPPIIGENYNLTPVKAILKRA